MAYSGPIAFPVIEGGTGDSSFTAYSVITGGTTSTGALQNVSGVGTAGQVLTSNGASMLPTWQTGGSGGGGTLLNIQVFTSNGTYTPTAGMTSCVIEALGGGGAGGGASNTTGGGSGGGAGGYSRAYYTAATIGASQSITIGAGGTGVSAGNGNNGGNTTVGALITANGGSGGLWVSPSQTTLLAGGAGGSATSSGLNITGHSGAPGYGNANSGTLSTFVVPSGPGADSPYGGGGPTIQYGTGGGIAASGFGAGGGGAYSTSTSQTGGAGAGGLVIVTEFK